MATPTITSVDRSAAGYTSYLLDCIADLWKRVYDYASALFAYLFGSSSNYVELPLPLVGIIADYAFDLQDYREFIQLNRTLYQFNDRYNPQFKMRNLTRELAAIKWLADAFSHLSLLKKIENLFLTTYKMDGRHKERIGCLTVCDVYDSLAGLPTQEEGVNAVMIQWQMNKKEAEQAWHLWTGFKKIDCLMNALASHYGSDYPIPPDGACWEARTPLPQHINVLIPEGAVDLTHSVGTNGCSFSPI